MRQFFNLMVIFFMIITFMSRSGSQENEEPILTSFQEHFKKEYFQLGTVMQFVFDYQNERTMNGHNGFSVANMRLKLKGEFDGGFGYAFQTSFTSAPSILDANMYCSISPPFTLRIGQFKAPFSKEYLISAPDIDFVNRSRVVSALTPGRQIGLQLSSLSARDAVSFQVGLFNGNGFSSNTNDSDDFLYAGRITFLPQVFHDVPDNYHLEVGVNAAFSKDSLVSIVNGLLPGYSGDRLLLGADMRLNFNRFLLAGEYIRAKLKPDTGEEITPSGFHATTGYMVTPKVQVLFRWDHFNLDILVGDSSKSDWLIWGVNVWPTGTTELQVNYIVDIDDSGMKHHQVLVNTQIVF